MRITRAVARFLLLIGVNLIVAFAVLEGVFLLFLHVPAITAASPGPVRRLMQQVYRHFTRSLIQFDADCARYDPEVTYTLRPGSCTFESLEFTSRFVVNRLGLRDHDSALDQPEVIIVGDSHAMGWGVEQERTFPRVLSARAGLKVLNAAVSSYGTVREMTVLGRIDTSRLRWLIVQYSDNDVIENRAFRDHNNRLPITGQAEYENIVGYYRSQRPYYAGKYVFRLAMKLTRLETPEPVDQAASPVSPTEEAELFLNALLHAGRTKLDTLRLVVLDVGQDFGHPRAFIAALAGESRRPGYPAVVRELRTLDTTTLLSADDFYVLDDHMRASGHRKIGEALAAIVRESGR
jgi:hypothetical protein